MGNAADDYFDAAERDQEDRETLRLCGYDLTTLDNIDGERG